MEIYHRHLFHGKKKSPPSLFKSEGGLFFSMKQVPVRFTLRTLGKNFSRLHFEIFFLFFPENRIRHFMHTVTIFVLFSHKTGFEFPCKNKKHINLSSAKFAQRVVKLDSFTATGDNNRLLQTL